MKYKEIAKEIQKVFDMQAEVAAKMVEDIKDTLNNDFDGSIDWIDYETEDDEVWTPSMDYVNYWRGTCDADVHIEQVMCNEDGEVYITLENDESCHINDLNFEDLHNLYRAIANLCEYLEKQ